MKAIKTFILTLLIVLAVCFAFMFIRSGRMRRAAEDLAHKAENKAKQETVKIAADQFMPLIEKALSSKLQSNGLSKEQADAVIASVSDEDKAKLTEIASNHFDAILETAWYIDAGDVENLTDSLQKELNEEELATLTEIYNKYVPKEAR